MPKEIDQNGYITFRNNPVTKEGVFPYLGKTISKALEPEKIYYVYRPFSELSSPETLASFDGVPFIDDHEMLGEGFTPCDRRPAQGVLMNPRPEGGNTIVADLRVFSEELKEKITAGKKQLSLGYLCSYELRRGTFDGKPYDAVQRNIRGNHIALVERGRMGSDIRVYDAKFTFDEMEINEKELEMADETDKNKKSEDEKVDKRKLIDEVGGILKGKVDEEIWRTIIGKIEKAAYNDSEAGTNDSDDEGGDKGGEKKSEKAAADKCGKDEDNTPEGGKKEEKDADGEKKYEAQDAAIIALGMLERKAKLIEQLRPHIGYFACDGMTDEEVALYGCKKLNLNPENGSAAKAMLAGYFAAAGAKAVPAMAQDAAPKQSSAMDAAFEKYLKGE